MFSILKQTFFCFQEKKITTAHSKRPPIGSNKNVIFNLSIIQKIEIFNPHTSCTKILLLTSTESVLDMS